jgi:hypothetical protein
MLKTKKADATPLALIKKGTCEAMPGKVSQKENGENE